jgi:ribosome-associated protein
MVIASLEDDKAEDVIIIPLTGRSPLADYMVIASGRSSRQVAAMANHLREHARKLGLKPPRVEGMTEANWVIVDTGDVIVHLFRPEVRSFYNLEKMWVADSPSDSAPLSH